MRRTLPPLTATAILIAAVASAAPTELVRIDDVAMHETVARAFTLDHDQEAELGGVKLRRQHGEEPMTAWILDARTRSVVWEMGAAKEYRLHSATAHFKSSVRLPAGNYELYLATFPAPAEVTGFWDWLWSVLSFELGDPDEHVAEVELWLRGEGRPGGEVTPESVRSRLAAGAVVALTCVGDNARLEKGFEVSAPLEVEVEASGEITRSQTYDGARILDADTHRTVWLFDREHSTAGGGADKNRHVATSLRLEPGRYVAQYWTDDSHSCPRYLSSPPYDAFTWGLVVRPHDPAELAEVAPFEYRDPFEHAVIVNLTRVGDDEHRSAGFALTRPLDVLVRAVGEGRADQMFDYGWILNADTRQPVWTMTYRATEPAGGAPKNRTEEEVLSLPPGRYVVHFVSDGSHAFEDWNSDPPSQPESWGIVVAAASGTLPTGAVRPFADSLGSGAIARIGRVGNNAHDSEPFQLDRPTEVLVVAVGEGTRAGMVDYGWITEAGSGKTVWRMDYGRTEPAGGAAKNRLARERLTLAPGRYELHYSSDDSHAFERWNDAPPFDPDAWGIAVYPAPPPGVVEDPGTSAGKASRPPR